MHEMHLSPGGLGNGMLEGIALLAAIAISIIFYHVLTRRHPIRSIWQIFGLIVGAELSIFILLCFILPEGLMDEGEIIGPMLLTLYLTPLFWRLKRDSLFLAREKERAEITLASIGDAVITTDINGCVELINPVAERLTGWANAEARGRRLEEVFHIVDRAKRELIPTPARKAIASGEVVGLGHDVILQARNGREYPIEDSAAPIRDEGGRILGCVLVFRDVSESYDLMQKISWQAGHDPLTGLPNRALLADRMRQTMAQAERAGHLMVVALIDLDGFKPINDLYGHEAGDSLLIEIANRLQSAMRTGDTVARLGGDEFVLLLAGIAHEREIEPAIGRICDVICQSHSVKDAVIAVSASIGISTYPRDGLDADALIRQADQAMYQVKHSGRSHFRMYDPETENNLQARHSAGQQVRSAIMGDELQLYYQPKVDLRFNRVVGVEALLRWMHPINGMTPPMEFIRMAEQTGLLMEVDRWVLREALDQMTKWKRNGLDMPVSINISASSLQEPAFFAYIESMLDLYPQSHPEHIELEIVETATLGNLKKIAQVIAQCQAMGLKIALDDFGTGYSSLAHIKNLSADTVKIDQSFVRDMLDDREHHALVEAVINLSRLFNCKVVAEGVESMMHGVRLMSLGCDLAQGYGIARPMPPGEIPGWTVRYASGEAWVC